MELLSYPCSIQKGVEKQDTHTEDDCDEERGGRRMGLVNFVCLRNSFLEGERERGKESAMDGEKGGATNDDVDEDWRVVACCSPVPPC